MTIIIPCSKNDVLSVYDPCVMNIARVTDKLEVKMEKVYYPKTRVTNYSFTWEQPNPGWTARFMVWNDSKKKFLAIIC